MRMLKALCLVALTATAAGQASNSLCGPVSGAGTCNPADSVFLKTRLIELGIHPFASYGSEATVPSSYEYFGFCSSCRLGFICDFAGDGLSVGSPAYSGDYFVPGTPLEGFTVKYTTADGTPYTFNNAGLVGNRDIAPDAVSITSDDTVQQQSVWEGHTAHANIRITTTVPYEKMLFHTNLCITNTQDTPLKDVYYQRVIDPDQQQPWNGNFNTYNYVKYQPAVYGHSGYVNPTYPNLAAVVSRGDDGVYANFVLALGAFDERAFATHGGFNNLGAPEAWYKDSPSPTWLGYGGAAITLSDTSSMRYADEAINMVFKHDSLAPGEETCFKLYYGLSPDFETDIVVAESSSSSPTPSPSASASSSASSSASASASSSPSPSASESPFPSASPAPVSACLDSDGDVTCDILAHYELCLENFPGTENLVQDVCPDACGCCVIDGECTCDNDADVMRCTSKFGYKVGCKRLRKLFGCNNRWIGPYLREHCPCTCAATSSPVDPAPLPSA